MLLFNVAHSTALYQYNAVSGYTTIYSLLPCYPFVSMPSVLCVSFSLCLCSGLCDTSLYTCLPPVLLASFVPLLFLVVCVSGTYYCCLLSSSSNLYNSSMYSSISLIYCGCDISRNQLPAPVIVL